MAGSVEQPVVFDDVTEEFQQLFESAFESTEDDKDLSAIVNQLKSASEVTQKRYVSSTGLSEDDAKIEVSANIHLAVRTFSVKFIGKCKEKRALAQGLGRLLDIGIVLGTEKVTEPDLPFRMLEDLLHIQTIQDCRLSWSLLEARSEQLTNELYMPRKGNTKSKLAMLRIANFLLRRLSQSHHTVFCGRIMMFLAYAFPLSERSGVNLLGSHNESNVTDYESQELYEETERVRKEAMSSIQVDGPDDIDKDNSVEYALYSSFWGIQRFFNAKPDKSDVGCVFSVSNWESFNKSANVVLSALEAKPFSDIELARAATARQNQLLQGASVKESMEVDDESSKEVGDDGSFYCTKYLSNSRLLRLQLSDAELRRNVLCQFLVLLHELKSPQIKLGAKITLDQVQEICKKLKKRTLVLLRATPPDGNEFTRLVQHVIKREVNWELWKEQKCVAYERDRIDESDEYYDDDLPTGRPTPKIKSSIMKNCKLWGNQLKSWQESHHLTTPVLQEYIQPMVDALDPENCIEEEYHPKHDAKYCWKGLRLVIRSQIKTLEHVSDGKFETAVKAMTGKLEKVGDKESTKEDICMKDKSKEEKTLTAETSGDGDPDASESEESGEGNLTSTKTEKSGESRKRKAPDSSLGEDQEDE